MATLRGVAIRTTESLEVQEEQFRALEASARSLGATTRFTASEAAQGLLFLARAGFTVNEALAAIPSTLNLAAAAGLNLGESSDIASNILRQFSLAAQETERVADTLVNTANRANTDVRQLAEALRVAGPIAGSLGQSVEETAAAIGALGDAGLQGSLAGTQLRGVMSSLLDPTTEARDVIESMGLSVEDLNPSVRSLTEIFEEFERAQLDATEAVRIFEKRNAAAALILSGSTEKVRELTQANKDAAGESRRLAEIVEDTLAGGFRNLRSAIEEAFLRTGDTGLLGFLKRSVSGLTTFVRALAGSETAVLDLNDAWIIARTNFLSGIEAISFRLRDTLNEALRSVSVQLLDIADAVAGEGGDSLKGVLSGITADVLTELSDRLSSLRVDPARLAAEHEERLQSLLTEEAKLLSDNAERRQEIIGRQREQLDLENETRKTSEDLLSIEEKLNAVQERSIVSAREFLDIQKQVRDIIREFQSGQGPPPPLGATQRSFLARTAAQRTAEQFELSQLAGGQLARQGQLDIGRLSGVQLAEVLSEINDREARRNALLARRAELVRRLAAELSFVVILERAADRIGDAFGNAIEDIIIEFDNLRDAVESFAKAIQRILVQELVARPLAQTLSTAIQGVGLSLAAGIGSGGSSGSQPIPAPGSLAAQHGTIFSEPTFFRGVSGRRGVLGEAGTEGLFPLARDSQGNLAVRAVGGGQRPIVININGVTDFDSFRRSQRQVAVAVGRIARGVA